jgi:hypothetical protein
MIMGLDSADKSLLYSAMAYETFLCGTESHTFLSKFNRSIVGPAKRKEVSETHLVATLLALMSCSPRDMEFYLCLFLHIDKLLRDRKSKNYLLRHIPNHRLSIIIQKWYGRLQHGVHQISLFSELSRLLGFHGDLSCYRLKPGWSTKQTGPYNALSSLGPLYWSLYNDINTLSSCCHTLSKPNCEYWEITQCVELVSSIHDNLRNIKGMQPITDLTKEDVFSHMCIN